MKPLAGHTFLAVGEMAQRPLARYLESLGAARLERPLDAQGIAMASFLIDDEGLARLADRGITRDTTAALEPAAGARVGHGLRQPRSALALARQ